MWCSKIPPRVVFFSWIVTLGKILTLDRLYGIRVSLFWIGVIRVKEARHR